MIINSYAKINLGLHVLNQREDGFHNIVTIFQEVNFCDKITIEESKALIKKYEDQQNKVRNNREFDSLTKELEYQNLEIQLAEKRIKEADFGITSKKEILAAAQEKLDSRAADLKTQKR